MKYNSAGTNAKSRFFLKQFKCHKVVRAGKITMMDVDEQSDLLMVHCEPELVISVPLEFLQRHSPEIGGYLVVYPDDYLSYSPAGAFEAGYHVLELGSSSGSVGGESCAEIDPEAADFSDALMWLKEGKRIRRSGWNGAGQFAWMVPPGSYPARMEAIKGHYPDDMVPYGAYFALKNAQETVVPWVPSIGDLMATDWQVVS